MNPAMMSGMLKQTFSSNIYNIVLFVGMGYLFSGFILAKIPFQLSQRFRKMLQGDFKIPQLDVSYVSSMSW
jgi:ER membrane protein complex subunit 3